MARLPEFQVSGTDYCSEEATMSRYRGPIRFDSTGELDASIREAHSRCGFYVFEGVLEADELVDIERDVADMPRSRATTSRRSTKPRLILYAIDARKQRFARETSYRYRPLAGRAAQYRWTPAAKADIEDYNLLDLGI